MMSTMAGQPACSQGKPQGVAACILEQTIDTDVDMEVKAVERWGGLLACSFILAACSAMDAAHDSPDYYRHSLSQLSEPLDGGDYLWFDVKLTPEYPDQSEVAEEQRMEWLTAWLEVRKICANGYDIIERRPFDFLEHNPARYDLRYKVRCAPPPATG